MKTMKRIAAVVLAIGMVLSFAACGGSEKVVTLRGDATGQMGGIPAEDTWIMTAKGDTVQTMNEILAIDLSDYDEETTQAMIDQIDSLILTPAEAIEGVSCVGSLDGTTYILDLTVDCTGDGLAEAAAAGLVTIDGSANKISLRSTQAALQQQGYEVVE